MKPIPASGSVVFDNWSLTKGTALTGHTSFTAYMEKEDGCTFHTKSVKIEWYIPID